VCTGKRELAGVARGLDYLGHVGAQPPYAVSRFANARVQQRIRRWFREQRFDVTVCDFLDAAVNFPGRLNIPSVLFQHNVESESGGGMPRRQGTRSRRRCTAWSSGKCCATSGARCASFSM